jgi:hypothetical protein
MHQRFALAAVAVILLSPITSFAQDMPVLPDSTKTPGVAIEIVPDDKTAACLTTKTGESVAEGDAITLKMICTPGYTQCIRNVTTAVKKRVYASYGLPDGNHTGYCNSKQGCEIDHLISLELGGSNDEGNLWPEPFQGEALNAHVKDQLENRLHVEVCAGNVSLKDAQNAISTDWVTAYKKFVGDPPQ